MISRERALLLGLCVLAGARVLFFSAAFPFFNNVDERAHVDLVVKYAAQKPPTRLEYYSHESARLLAFYSSPEYFDAPGESEIETVWTLPPNDRAKTVAAICEVWEARRNHESGEPPLYYAFAGALFNLCHGLGLRGIDALYAIRFLNVAFAVALIALGYSAARYAFPARPIARCAVPLFLALWPQTTFFSIQSDALTPLLFGAAFVAWMKLMQAERGHPWLASIIGLATAATCLTKTNNLVLVPVVVVAVALVLLQRKTESLTSRMASFAAFLVCLFLPLAAWALRNRATFGDFTATRAKIDILTWTAKPVAAWFDHPIFSLHGSMRFLSHLLATFWRGEFIWLHRDLLLPWADYFCCISSVLLLFFALLSLGPRLASVAGDDTRIFCFALISIVTLVLSLALLSIMFDFGTCIYPSSAWPFFTSGRLLNAAAIPFFLLYARGIDAIARWSRVRWIDIVLVAVVAAVTITAQLILYTPALRSPFNFFHAPHGELS